MLSGTLGLGAGVALLLGGIITQTLSWHWLFVAGAAIGALSFVLVAAWTPQTSRSSAEEHIDYVGGVLLTVGLLSLLLAVSQSSSWGWLSPLVVGLLALAVIALAVLVLVELRTALPLADVRLLSSPALALTNGLSLFLGFIPYLFYVGLPLLLQAHGGAGQGLSVTETGLALLPGAILVFLGGRLTLWLLTRMHVAVVAASAMAAMLAGSLGVAFIPGSLSAIVVFFAVMGLGNGIGFAVTGDLVSRITPPGEIAGAVGMNTVIRAVGSTFGAPVTALIVATAAPTAGVIRELFLVAAAFSLVGAGVGASIRLPRSPL